ncbi:MAG: phosphate ABC transporter permease subunit PstC [Gemmataceae bacterium]
MISLRMTSVPASSCSPTNDSRAVALVAFDGYFKLLCQAAACLIVLVSLLLLVVLVVRSWLGIQTFGLPFLLSTDWNPVAEPPRFGSLAFVYGTLVTSAIAMLIAVPLGVGTAAYLSEIAGPRLRRIASFFIEMLAAIPSVIYGFWGLYVLAPLVGQIFRLLGSNNVSGRGLLSAGLVLSVMIVPYIAAISYDVCQAVPRSQREGALALGATRWQTIWRVVLPYARPGILAGAFLALGRALGETMAVTMLIGNRTEVSLSLFGQGDSIASKLANQYMEADTRLFSSVLVELGLILLLVTVLINSLARWLLSQVGQNGPWLSFGQSATLEVATTEPSKPWSAVLPRMWWLSAEGVNRIMTVTLGCCVVFTMALLILILGYLTYKGVSALNWEFFTQLPVPPTETGGGLKHAIVGSLTVVGLASLFAVPIGLLTAIYLAEYRSNWLSSTVRSIAEQLGGVPSIVIGIFASSLFGYLAVWLEGVTGSRVRLYGWSAVFALAVMMIPIVLRASEEALRLVPMSLRTASQALGASQAQTILRVVLPAALPAIITAIFLSVARIAGETAPLLLTAGENVGWPDSLGDFMPTLPPYIYRYATSAFENQQRQAWAAAFVLMSLVLLLNFGIRLVTGKRVVQASRAD